MSEPKMKFPLLAKAGALGAVTLALVIGLSSIDGLIEERQQRQAEAERSVADALAGAQTVLGPVLQRVCTEVWTQVEGEGAQRKTVVQRRAFTLNAWPTQMDVQAQTDIEPRWRGIFRSNTFVAQVAVQARWDAMEGLRPTAQQPGGQVQCDDPTVNVAVNDARGIRAVQWQADAQTLTAAAGSGLGRAPNGFHAALPWAPGADDRALAQPLSLRMALTLAGTHSLSWVPVAGQTAVTMRSDWPHPSFNGRFLPTQHGVTDSGFDATWRVSALASTAAQAWLQGAALCAGADTGTGGGTSTMDLPTVEHPGKACVDTFGVRFIDPVNTYVLGDRALKYSDLFIGLTFLGVGLVEVLRRVRVHPVQYALVGAALTMFFLLLVSLSEHLAFGWAYGLAAAACSTLLAVYGRHVLNGTRAGLALGGGVATLYGVLWALLQMEQTALVLGAVLLFAVLSAVMVATRRLDWYALVDRMRAPP